MLEMISNIENGVQRLRTEESFGIRFGNGCWTNQEAASGVQPRRTTGHARAAQTSSSSAARSASTSATESSRSAARRASASAVEPAHRAARCASAIESGYSASHRTAAASAAVTEQAVPPEPAQAKAPSGNTLAATATAGRDLLLHSLKIYLPAVPELR